MEQISQSNNMQTEAKLYIVGEWDSIIGKCFIVNTLRENGSFEIKVVRPCDEKLFILKAISLDTDGNVTNRYENSIIVPKRGSIGYTYLTTLSMIESQSKDARYGTYLAALKALKEMGEIPFIWTMEVVRGLAES